MTYSAFATANSQPGFEVLDEVLIGFIFDHVSQD
jgi:hypothetical protein